MCVCALERERRSAVLGKFVRYVCAIYLVVLLGACIARGHSKMWINIVAFKCCKVLQHIFDHVQKNHKRAQASSYLLSYNCLIKLMGCLVLREKSFCFYLCTTYSTYSLVAC